MRKMWRVTSCALGAALLALTSVLLAPALAVTNGNVPPGWTTYRNDRFGFQLAVPPDVFVEAEARNKEQGAIWISRDRQARLLAVATRNETGETLKSYREFLIQNSYKGAAFDYAPQKDTWFALSGYQGREIFYERIFFACDGRYIYGWQMRYPASRKKFYDRIVEDVHKTFVAGRGEDGNCGPR